MDPNEALKDAREAADNLFAQFDSEDPSSSAIEQEAHMLAERFAGLDEWLSKDGFLPMDWDKEEHKPGAGGDMEVGRALSLAIFAINTFMHPDASSDADVAVLEANSDEVIEALVELRAIYEATKRT